MEDEIVSNILDLLQPLCPGYDLKHPSSAYHTSCIREIVERYKGLNNPFISSYDESIRVGAMNSIIEHVKIDLIEGKHDYLWRRDKPKDDYERGVLNVIRLIQFRIHCILD